MPSVVANSLQITAYCLFMIAKDPVALISALFTSRFLGSFTVDEIGLDYIDAQGQRIEGEGLPQGGKLTQSISLVGTMGVVRKTLPLKGVLGAEGVKIRNEWWLQGALHPASCRMTLLDISGRVVGAGSVGLKWHPY
jgi:hypothetical protein